MFSLIDIFESIEQFAYKMLIWILIVPKTLVMIVVDPGWARTYITTELKEKERNRFDDYFSPVFLLLLVSILPFIYFRYYAVYPSLTIQAPGRVNVGDQVYLTAQPTFISQTGPFNFDWHIRYVHNDNSDDTIANYRTDQPSMEIRTETAGHIIVDLRASNPKGEVLYAYVEILVGDESSENLLPVTPGTDWPSEQQDLVEYLKDSENALPALSFLGVPLLFALAAEPFRGKTLSGENLKRSYYIQCYYFAPFYLVVYAAMVAPGYFLAPDEYWIGYVMIGVMYYIFLWLFVQESRLIAAERRIHWFPAFLITLVCFTAVFLITAFIGEIAGTDELRLGLWYILTGSGLVVIIAGWVRSLVRRRKRGG